MSDMLPIKPVITIEPVSVTAASQNSSQPPSPLASQPNGALVEGFVVMRDIHTQPILRTAIGDIKLHTPLFLKTGTEVSLRVDHSQPALARILTINGQSLEAFSAQHLLGTQAKTSDAVIWASSAAQLPLASAAGTVGAWMSSGVLLQPSLPAGIPPSLADTIMRALGLDKAQRNNLSSNNSVVPPPLQIKAHWQPLHSQTSSPTSAAQLQAGEAPISPSAIPSHNAQSAHTAASMMNNTTAPSLTGAASAAMDVPISARPSALAPIMLPATPSAQVPQAITMNINSPADNGSRAILQKPTSPHLPSISHAPQIITDSEILSEIPAPKSGNVSFTPPTGNTPSMPITHATHSVSATTLVTPLSTTQAFAQPELPEQSPQAQQPPVIARSTAAREATPLPVTSEDTPDISIVSAQQLALKARVIGHDHEGSTVLHTPLGSVKLYTSQPIAQNQEILLHIMTDNASGEGVDTEGLSNEAQQRILSGWPSLSNLMQHAASDNLRLPASIAALLPHTGRNLSHGMLFFLSALKGGDIRQWLGSKTLQDLEQLSPARHKELLQEFGAHSISYNETNNEQWISSTLPLLHEQQLQSIRLHVRPFGEDNESASRAKQASGHRFVIDVDLTALGAMQFDGLVKRHSAHLQCDLMIRSEQPLDEKIRQDIHQIFTDCAAAAGFTGSLIFQPSIDYFVRFHGSEQSANGILA